MMKTLLTKIRYYFLSKYYGIPLDSKYKYKGVLTKVNESSETDALSFFTHIQLLRDGWILCEQTKTRNWYKKLK